MDALLSILGYLAPFLTALFGWLVGKRKSDNDLITQQLETLQRTLDFNGKLVEDKIKITEDFTKIKSENDTLKNNQIQLQKEVERLTKENQELRKTVGELKAQLDAFLRDRPLRKHS